jgi:predicted DNA-binding protein (MmcQ/YjbR family)
MIDLIQLFRGRKYKISALKKFGFKERGGQYFYSENILDGQFEVRVKINNEGVSATVYDLLAGDNYYLHTVEGAAGGFVAQVREEYERIIGDISEKCFEKGSSFSCDVSRAVVAYAKKTYRSDLEFLWKDDDNAILRRRDNKKWYAVFMKVAWEKLGLSGEGKAEIVDLMAPREEIARLVDGKNYLPGWHMNKKTWITIPLDGRVPAEVVCWVLDLSYVLAKKGSV